MKQLSTLVASLFVLPLAQGDSSTVPADYKGKPFQDSVYKAGPQNIPGILPCALYDLGGEGGRCESRLGCSGV